MKNIKPILEQRVDPQSHLVTDESSVYYMMKPAFAKHSAVNHSQKEYARREENFTVKYLGQYCAERDFVYNGRKLTDDQRTERR